MQQCSHKTIILQFRFDVQASHRLHDDNEQHSGCTIELKLMKKDHVSPGSPCKMREETERRENKPEENESNGGTAEELI